MRRCLFGATVAIAVLAIAHSARAQEPRSSAGGLDSLLNTRITSAAKYAQTISEVAGAITIVTSDEIERYGYRTLADVLAAARGFYVSDDRNYSYVGVRGFGRPTDYNNRILLLLDGYVINDGIWGGAPIGNELGIDLSTLERIEIVRGPSSALYGTRAMFGIINLVTKEGSVVGGLNLQARGGSYGRLGSSVLFGRKLAGGSDLLLSGFWDDARGQDLYFPAFDAAATNWGIAHDADGERRAGFLARFSTGGLTIESRYSSREKVIPTGAYGTIFDNSNTRTTDRYGLLQVGYERQLSPGKRLQARTYFGHYSYDGDYDSDPTAIYQESAADDVLGTEATLQGDLSSANRLTVGTEAVRHLRAEYWYPRFGPREFDLSAPFSVLSGYVQDEYQLTRRWSILAGVRWDRYSNTGNAAAPRAAIVFAPSPRSTFKLLYGGAYRAPNLSENAPSSQYYTHNPALGAERLWTAEIIYQQRIGRGLLGTVSLYDTDARRLIEQIPDGRGGIMFTNVGGLESSGIELGLDARMSSRLSGYASYAFQRSEDNDHHPLTNSPAHLLKLGGAAQLGSGLRSGLEIRYESSRRTIQGSETNGFVLANLNLIVSPQVDRGFLRALNRFDFVLKLNNLFGTDYAVPAGFEHLEASIPQNGRNVVAELKLRF